MKESARYVKIVEWTEEDQCYVGSAPGLFYGGCHGSDERRVFDELCQIVEETIENAQSLARGGQLGGKEFTQRRGRFDRDQFVAAIDQVRG